MFDPVLYPMNDDWFDFAVGVVSVGDIYGRHGALQSSTGPTKTLRHELNG